MTSPSARSELHAPTAVVAAAMLEGLRSARVALERLFAPASVTLQEVPGWPSALVQEGAVDLAAPQLGVAFDVAGPVATRLVILAGPGDDTRLAAALLRRVWTENAPRDPDDQAAFSEMANILASSFLNGLARELKLTLVPSVPTLVERPLAEVIGAIETNPAWGLGARFTVALPSGNASGLFVAAPDPTPGQ